VTLRLSYSQITAFRACPLKWWLNYQVGLRSPSRSEALGLGSAFHHVMDKVYQAIKGGVRDVGALTEVAGKAIADTAEMDFGARVPEDLQERLTWMVAGYFEQWGADERYQIIATEDDEVTMPLMEGVDLIGRIDLVVEDLNRPGALEIWDHKTAGKRDVSQDAFAAELQIDDQFAIYVALKRAAGENVIMARKNLVRTDRLKRAMDLNERFHRVPIFYSNRELNIMLADVRRVAKAILAAADDPERIYSNPDPKNCGFSCDFKNVHMVARSGGHDIVAVAIESGFTTREMRARERERLWEEEQAKGEAAVVVDPR
jgi:RecB family exonuclease